jgi:F-type H+-transporting ATPase subunit delta
MKQARASIRYAKAFLQLSIEQNSLEDSFDDMRLLDTTCSENRELRLLLKSPIVKTDQKIKILNEIFAKKAQRLSLDFVNIIIRKKREYLLAAIAKIFIDLYKTEKNIETATVTTASPISALLKDKIVSYIKSRNNNKVELIEVVDNDIIGGAIIRIGDKELDASIASDISELRQTFNKNLYLQNL